MGVGSEIYSGAAGFGQFWSFIKAIIASFIAIGLVIAGIYILYHKSHLKLVIGKNLKPSMCTTQNTQQGPIQMCSTEVSYMVDGKTYTRSFSGNTEYAKTGMDVKVYYNPADPTDAEIEPIPTWVAWMLFGFAILIVIGSWFWVWLTRKYKCVAAATGTMDVYGLLTGN